MKLFFPCLVFLVILSPVCRGAPGELDTGFGTRGKVTTGFAEIPDTALPAENLARLRLQFAKVVPVMH